MSEQRFFAADELARDIILDLDLLLSRLQLTEKQTEVLELHFKQGYTQEEIAKKWDTSQVNVFYHVRAIKSKIKKELEGWGKCE